MTELVVQAAPLARVHQEWVEAARLLGQTTTEWLAARHAYAEATDRYRRAQDADQSEQREAV